MLKADVIVITKARIAASMKATTEDSGNVFFKAIVKNFLLTRKYCSWPTFYQMDFMKR